MACASVGSADGVTNNGAFAAVPTREMASPVPVPVATMALPEVVPPVAITAVPPDGPPVATIAVWPACAGVATNGLFPPVSRPPGWVIQTDKTACPLSECLLCGYGNKRNNMCLACPLNRAEEQRLGRLLKRCEFHHDNFMGLHGQSCPCADLYVFTPEDGSEQIDEQLLALRDLPVTPPQSIDDLKKRWPASPCTCWRPD